MLSPFFAVMVMSGTPCINVTDFASSNLNTTELWKIVTSDANIQETSETNPFFCHLQLSDFFTIISPKTSLAQLKTVRF